MKKILILLALVLGSQSAFAIGTRGGGSGCMAEFARAGFVVSQWLVENGSKLKPQVKSVEFLSQVNLNDVIQTDDNLEYKNNPVDALYDGTHIKLNCTRFLSHPDKTRERVLAHEIFRKMGLEGDNYEVSRQIWIESSADVGNITTRSVEYLKCPAIQSVADRKDKWRDAYLEVSSMAGERTWSPGTNPAFTIDGVYVQGKVICDSVSDQCVAMGNVNKPGKIFYRNNSQEILVLKLPVGRETLEFECDLRKSN